MALSDALDGSGKSALVVVDAPRSESDVIILLQEVNASPFIGQLTLEEIDDRVKAKTIRFFYHDAALVGFGAWDPIDVDWCEIGPFYSLAAFRGQHIGLQIVETLIELNSGRNLYAVTKNPIARKLFAQFGFREVSVLKLPWPIVRHLMSRLSWGRLMNLGRKLSLDSVTHHVKAR